MLSFHPPVLPVISGGPSPFLFLVSFLIQNALSSIILMKGSLVKGHAVKIPYRLCGLQVVNDPRVWTERREREGRRVKATVSRLRSISSLST